MAEYKGLVGSFEVQPDGKILLGGGTQLVRLNSDGSLDTSFSPSAVTSVHDIALQEDGKILISERAVEPLRRLNADGTRDESFEVPSLTVDFVPRATILPQPDGRILIAGGFTEVNGAARPGIARLNSDGSLDSFNPTFASGSMVLSMALQADGKLHIAGLMRSADGTLRPEIARLNPDGTLDETFPVIGLPAPAEFLRQFGAPIALADDGTIWAGSFTNIVRVTNPQPVAQNLSIAGSALTWLRGESSPEVYHATFEASNDGSEWRNLGRGTRIPGGWKLDGVNVSANERIRARGYVSGSSTYVESYLGLPVITSEPLDLARDPGTTAVFQVIAKGTGQLGYQWYKDGTAIAGAQLQTLTLTNVSGADTAGYSVTVTDSTGSVSSRVARLSVLDPMIRHQPASQWLNSGDTLALDVRAEGSGLRYQWRKNGVAIEGATSQTLSISNVTASDTADYEVIVSGNYGAVTSSVASVRVNMVLPDAWRVGFSATTEWFPIQATAIQPNRDVIVGGLFQSVGMPPRMNLARFRPDGLVDLAFAPEPAGPEPASVNTIVVLPDEHIIVGGSFTEVGGKPRPYLARLEIYGALDESFSPVIEGTRNGSPTQIIGVELQPDGRLLIAGEFSTVNGEARPGVARLLPDGTLDPKFNPNAAAVPSHVWSTVTQPDGKIIAYGWGLTRLNADGSADTTFTPGVNASSYSKVIIQPDNRILVDGARLNPDGTLEKLFNLPVDGRFVGLQANGKILASRIFDRVQSDGRAAYALVRYNPDGSFDPAVSAVFDNYFLGRGVQADGDILVTGAFTRFAGEAADLPYKLAALKNSEPATTSLAFDGTTVTWLRGGSSPEVSFATFDFSLGNTQWTLLGAGTRIPGGWELRNVRLSSPGIIRARGFAQGSIFEEQVTISTVLSLQAVFDSQTDQTVVTCNAKPGVRITLETSTDLKNWSSVESISAASERVKFTLPKSSTGIGFYRVRQVD